MKRFPLFLMIALSLTLIAAQCGKDPDPKPDPKPDGNDDSITNFPSEMPACAAFVDQIVDGGFETQWFTQKTSDSVYLEYQSSVFHTLNSLYSIKDVPAMQVTEAPVTAQIDSVSPYSGKYALKLVTGRLRDAGKGSILIPGAIAPLNDNYVYEFLYMNGRVNTKTPYTAKPTALHGYYKYAPVAGDSASIVVQLYNGNDEIAVGEKVEYGFVNGWTRFNIPINYTSDVAPTHISIVVASSAGYNFSDLTNCQGQPGSTLWIDELQFDF